MKTWSNAKLANLLIAAMLLLFPGFSTFISEINFGENEFIEIYSPDALNLTGALLFDEGGIEKANTLYDIKSVNDTFFYLIVGEDFISNYNISNLNCSVYSTGKSGIGYYGLKNSGENITVNVNNSLNVTWGGGNGMMIFDQNQSLHIYDDRNYSISSFSICNYSYIDEKEENISIQTNITNTNRTFAKNRCEDPGFEITLQDGIYRDKIKFGFDTNISNFTIRYWIEDFLHENILKNIRNTTNTNKKSFTPKETGFYWINANLNAGNCTYNDSKLALFYKKEKMISADKEEKNDYLKETKNNLSHIIIQNQDELLNGANEIEYEIYRGDTRKRAVYFFLNGEKVFTAYPEKFSLFKGKLLIEKVSGLNNLSISGLGIASNLSFYVNTNITLDEKKSDLKEKQFFDIGNLSLKQHFLKFSIISNMDYTSNCYVLNRKTKVSNVLNVSENGNYMVEINESLFDNNDDMDNLILKLLCKYKKVGLKSVYYASENFNFSLISKNKKNNQEGEFTKTKFNTSSIESSSNVLNVLENEKILHLDELGTKTFGNYSDEYLSNGEKLKEGSYFPAFAGIVVIFSIFLTRW